MKKHALNIALCTIAMLAFTLIFGYTLSLVKDLKAMDLYHCSAKDLGMEMVTADSSKDGCDTEDVETAELTKGFIEKSMADSDVSCSVDIDYKNKCIICKVITDGIARALQEGDDGMWDSIAKNASETSAGWRYSVREAGLEDWHFALVILNDYYPKNVLLISTDGQIVYDCQRDGDKNII